MKTMNRKTTLSTMVLLPANADSEIIYGESMASMEDKEDIDPCILHQMKK